MSSKEKEVLLKIFPTEIWGQILGHVKDPEDYHKLCNASPYFRDLLLPRAPEILFPEVVKPILHQVQGEEISGRSEAVLRSHVLPFRQVCRAWREGVDQVLQTQHLNPSFPRDHDRFSGIFGSCQYQNFDRFHDSEDFYKLNRKFRSTHAETKANPFISRAVMFSVFLDEDEDDISDAEERYMLGMDERPNKLDDYFHTCSPFLRKYGDHIWTCVIDVSSDYERSHGDEEEQMLELYEWLKVILKRMPNLQHLEVEISGFSFSLMLPNKMQNSSFPTLPQLRFLSVSGSDDGWVWPLLEANPQVEMVDARSECWSKGTLEYLLEFATNLKGVALQPEELYTFCDADDVTAPVESLWLDARECNEVRRGQPFNWQRIFTAIQSHFSSTLKQLRLGFPKLVELQFDGGLALPQLKILELEFAELVPLDFLLPLKDTLEHLSVRTCSRLDTDRLDQGTLGVKLYEFWEKPEMSNAWVLFPKLKLLRTGKEKKGSWYSCTRDQWRNAQAS